MTQTNKLIVGAVVVLGVYYLYDRSRKMKAVSDLKAGAETPSPATIQPMTSTPLEVTEVQGTIIERANIGKKFSNFAGSRGNSMSAQYFR
jgi:hypothetical protein